MFPFKQEDNLLIGLDSLVMILANSLTANRLEQWLVLARLVEEKEENIDKEESQRYFIDTLIESVLTELGY